MAANGRKDVFRARSGEKPTGQKGMEMGEERRSVSPTLQSESAMPWKEEEGAKNGLEREEAQFMRFILASKDAAFFLLDEAELEKQMALLSANSHI